DDGGHLIVTVGIVEVDVIGLQAFQGAVDGGADVGGILSLVIGMIADLRGDDDVVAVAAGGQPGADDGLGFAAGLPRQPRRVGFGGVEEVAACGDEGVEDGVRTGLIGGPPESVGAEVDREDGQFGAGDLNLRHRSPQDVRCRWARPYRATIRDNAAAGANIPSPILIGGGGPYA